MLMRKKDSARGSWAGRNDLWHCDGDDQRVMISNVQSADLCASELKMAEENPVFGMIRAGRSLLGPLQVLQYGLQTLGFELLQDGRGCRPSGVEIPGDDDRIVRRVVPLDVIEDFPHLLRPARIIPFALEVRVVNHAGSAAPWDLNHKRHSAAPAGLHPRPSRQPSVAPVMKLVAKAQHSSPCHRKAAKNDLAVKCGLTRTTLRQLLKFRAEDVIHPQLAGEIFGNVSVSRSAGI